MGEETPLTFSHEDRGRLVGECQRVEALSRSQVFFPVVDTGHVLFWSVITEILIILRDLCWFADKMNARLGWKDDLIPDSSCPDVTALITLFRDGLCHSHTYHRFVNRDLKMVGVRNIVHGTNASIKISGTDLQCEYNDDFALFIGKERLYLKRHIVRAFRELLGIFEREGLISVRVAPSSPQSPAVEPPQNTKE